MFQKSVDTAYGVAATVWALDVVQEHFRNRTLDVVVVGYANQAAAENGAAPMAEWVTRLEGDNYMVQPSKEQLYDKLAALPDWDGAERLAAS